MAVFVSRLTATVGRLGAKNVVAGTRAVRGTSAVRGARALSKGASSRALSTAASHEAPFCLANPPPADPEALRSRWREQCLAIAGGAETPSPPRDSHELGGYFS